MHNLRKSQSRGKRMYVYKITNLINNKLYIGITKNIKSRFAYHRTRYCKASKREYKKKPLYQVMVKYGIENFKFEVLYKDLTPEEAMQKEIELIASLHTLSHEHGYNITKGGNYRSIKGEEVNTAKLTEEEVKSIYQRISNGETIKSIYEDYKDKITYSGFQNCYIYNWKHLERPKKWLPSGASISKDTVLEIRKLYDEGNNPHQIAKMLNLEYKKCWRICTRQTYTCI